MKRFAAVLLTLAVLLCPSVRAAGPGISAASAILIDGESGRVLYAQNAEEERPKMCIRDRLNLILEHAEGSV